MSVLDNLNNLENNIIQAKQMLANNINGKGVGVSENDTLTYLAEKVGEISQESGGSGSGFDFSVLGYPQSVSNQLNQSIEDNIAYSKTKYDEWNPSNTSAKSKFYGDANLVYVPNIDTSNATDMEQMFKNCSLLSYVPQLNTSNVINMKGMFESCSSLTEIPQLNTSNVITLENFVRYSSLESFPQLDTSKVTTLKYAFDSTKFKSFPSLNVENVESMYYTFYSNSNLEYIGDLNTVKCTDFTGTFAYAEKIKRIEGLSFKSITSYNKNLFGYGSQTTLRYAVFRDIGTHESVTSFDFSNLRVWGIASTEIPDARQSLIDSLITYSFDRAANGYSTCTITLYKDTKALLTEEEIAAITAKGYTIA